jgi:outer membrane protein OmpA-like peptidoglycan-associated protein
MTTYARALTLAFCWIALLQGSASAISPLYFRAYFEPGRADITKQGENVIGSFVSHHQNYRAKFQVVVYAHSDAAEASETLAKARGEAVRRRLIELGIPEGRILVFAYDDGPERTVELDHSRWNTEP